MRMEVIIKHEDNPPYRTYVFSVRDAPENKLWFGGEFNFKGYINEDLFVMSHLEQREELIREKLQEIADIIYKDII